MDLSAVESHPASNADRWIAVAEGLDQKTQSPFVEFGWPRERTDLSGSGNNGFHSEQTIKLAKRLRSARVPILITGSPGTEVLKVAQVVHEGRDSQVLRLGCNRLGFNQGDATYSELMALSQTGDQRRKQVWVLENVDETPLSHQAFLSAFVGRVLRCSNSTGPPILSTSGRKISQMVAREEFRPDLYYQLAAVTVSVPSLSERRKEIPQIINQLAASMRSNGNEAVRFTDDALAVLMNYKWPGNLFELRNAIAQISILADEPVVDAKRLRRLWRAPVSNEPPANVSAMSLEDAETQHILAAMKRCDGNKTAAANQLGISSRTLHNKIQKYRRFGLIE